MGTPNWKYLMAQYTGTDPQVRYDGPLARDGGLKSDLGGHIYNSGRTFIFQKINLTYYKGC